MTRTDLQESVKVFFEDYNKLWTVSIINASSIALFYHAPCVTLRADGSFHLLSTRGEVEAFFQRVADTYKGEGLHHGVLKSLSVIPIGGRSALATIDWELRREDDTLIRGWRQSYNVLRVGDAWQIILSTFHVL